MLPWKAHKHLGGAALYQCPQQPHHAGSFLWDEALPATLSLEVLSDPKATGRTTFLTHGPGGVSSPSAGSSITFLQKVACIGGGGGCVWCEYV